jgi:hydroxymethylbilane synthase
VKARSTLSFGTLPSALAKAQTQQVIHRLQAALPRIMCQVIIVPAPEPRECKQKEPYLAASAREVEYLEEQLLANEFQLMVQRAADLVLPLRAGLIFAAIPERNTPFDALLNREGLIADELPDGATVGVLNLRTKVQMQALWPRLRIRQLAGGVDCALELFLRRSEVDALVIPAAVAEHLGIQGIVSEIFYPEMMLPSSGQGILAVLSRDKDKEALALLSAVHSEASFYEMEAEHAFLQRFASDQDLPVSALAQVEHGQLRMTGAIGSVHGPSLNRLTHEGPAAEAVAIGTELAEKLLLSSDAVINLLEADFPDGLPQPSQEDPLLDELEENLDEDRESELNEDYLDELADDELPENP